MKTLATLYKEFLLLVRDPGGMALIFVMPLALVIVMSLVQDAPFRDYLEIKLDLAYVDQDRDSLGAILRKAFRSSPNIQLTDGVDTVLIKEEVRQGNVKACIIVPPHATETVRRRAKQMIGKVFANAGFPVEQVDTAYIPPVSFRLMFDPAIKANYRQAISGGLEKTMTDVQAAWVLDELQNQLAEGKEPKGKLSFDLSSIVSIEQDHGMGQKRFGSMMNSVQHNVPAWSLFAMFFILFPLAGNFIKEREEGSLLRLRLISGSQFPVMAGKYLFYFGICLSQFVLMVGVGIYLMPVLGLDRLVLGHNYFGIAATALAVALAATGFGMLIAVYFKTPQQALSFGSVTVVIFSALGGVWVPVYVMPEVLQFISRFSPMNWGLESFNNLFLRNAPISDILPELFKLTGFALGAFGLSFLVYRSRTTL